MPIEPEVTIDPYDRRRVDLIAQLCAAGSSRYRFYALRAHITEFVGLLAIVKSSDGIPLFCPTEEALT